MKKLLILLLLLGGLNLLQQQAMAQVPVAGPLKTLGSADNYPTHKDSLQKGGYRALATIAERDAIPNQRRKFGMLVHVLTDNNEQLVDKVFMFKGEIPAAGTTDGLDNSTEAWVEFKQGSGSGGNMNGTLNFVPRFTAGNNLVNSAIQDDGAKISINSLNGFVTTGTFGAGAIPVTGAGTRMMWYPGKAAFRAGQVSGAQWNEANIGNSSFATGESTLASGYYSTAMGSLTTASGTNSTAMGNSTTSAAYASLAIGQFNLGGGTPGSWIDTDPVFEIGNGTNSGLGRRNAFGVLKNGNTTIGGTLTIRGGTPGAGKVLTALDANGLASWETPTAGNLALPLGQIFIGSLFDVPTPVSMSGDVTLNNNAKATIANNAVTLDKLQKVDSKVLLGSTSTGGLLGEAVEQIIMGEGLVLENGKLSLGGSTASGGQLGIGDSYGGGVIFFLTPDKKHGLIVTTQDQSYSNLTSPNNSWSSAQNTVSDPSRHNTAGKAYTDWRLPTKYELGVLYIINDTGAIVPELIGTYWSSTEYFDDHDFAYTVDMSSNSVNSLETFKNFGNKIRAIRSF